MRWLDTRDLRKIVTYQKWMGELRRETGLISIYPDYFQVEAKAVEQLAPLDQWVLNCRCGKDLHIRHQLTPTTYICAVVDAMDGDLYAKCVRQMEGQEPQVDAPAA